MRPRVAQRAWYGSGEGGGPMNRTIVTAAMALSGCIVEQASVDDGVASSNAHSSQIYEAVVSAEPGPAAAAQTIQLNFLYVHGTQNSDADRMRAHGALGDLKANVDRNMTSWLQSYVSSHPGVAVNFKSAAANLYTANPSGWFPTDQPNPLRMDEWEV